MSKSHSAACDLQHRDVQGMLHFRNEEIDEIQIKPNSCAKVHSVPAEPVGGDLDNFIKRDEHLDGTSGHSISMEKTITVSEEIPMELEYLMNTDEDDPCHDDQLKNAQRMHIEDKCFVQRASHDVGTGPIEISPSSSDGESDCIPDIETVIDFENAVLSTMLPNNQQQSEDTQSELQDKLGELRALVEGEHMNHQEFSVIIIIHLATLDNQFSTIHEHDNLMPNPLAQNMKK